MDDMHPRAGRRLGAGQPLLVDSARPWAGGLLAGCAILVAVLGVLFAGQTTANSFDRAADDPVITWFGGHQGLAGWLAAPGSMIPVAVLGVAIVVACLAAGRLNGAVLALLAVPVAESISEIVLKPLIHRTYLGGISYPSGHTTAIAALAATVTVLLLVPPDARRARAGPGAQGLRAAILVILYALAGGVALGLIGLKWHYLTDIVAGAAVGTGTVCGLALVLDSPPARRWLGRRTRARTGTLARTGG